ncbi:hypothetical protein EDC96DRAFT_538911, partial [Choanephora cucurbitarum]
MRLFSQHAWFTWVQLIVVDLTCSFTTEAFTSVTNSNLFQCTQNNPRIYSYFQYTHSSLSLFFVESPVHHQPVDL